VTESSDAWVEQSFLVEARPARVLVVDPRGAAPAAVRVPRLDLNARSAPAGGDDLPVAQAFRTLQEAADAARGGDLVAVMPGTYEGFFVGDKADAGDGRYLRFRAMGRPGEVVIDRPNRRDPRWMVLLEAAHHVIVEGFNLAGAERAGDMSAKGPWAGIMLDGDFGRSGKQVHHVAVVGNFSHNHASWGLHSTDTHTVLIQDNLFALSAREHSAYVSDGSDNYVIRRNVFFGSFASGLQVNLDPEASFEEVMKHPALRGHPPMRPDRAWAQGLLVAAQARFGEHNFPDGRGTGFIIEENVINENGRRGGGSLNLAGLSRSLIQNNLIYGNHNHGIAQWDNKNPFDDAARGAGRRTPEEATAPERVPLFGCRHNLIRNNTVLMSHPIRAAVQCHHGSFGCRLYNNVFINDTGPSIEVDDTSIVGLEARTNVLNTWSDDGMPGALRPLAAALPDAAPNELGVTQARIAGHFVRAGTEPWVIIEKGWWRLNPRRPDFHPRAGSILAGRGEPARMAPRDLEGKQRTAADIGALGR
jgi:hypothetical protein